MSASALGALMGRAIKGLIVLGQVGALIGGAPLSGAALRRALVKGQVTIGRGAEACNRSGPVGPTGAALRRALVGPAGAALRRAPVV